MINIKLIFIIIFFFYQSDSYLKRGIKKYKKGKYEETISFLKKQKQIFKTENYYFYIANSYSFLDKNIDAIIYYDSAISLNSKNDRNFAERGLSYFITGNSKKALKDMNIAIKLNSKNSKYYVNRGTIYYDLGNNDLACKDWNNAINLDESNISYEMIKSNCN